MVSFLPDLPQLKIYQQIQSTFSCFVPLRSCTGMCWLCLHKLGHMLLYQGDRVAMYFFMANAWAIIICPLGSIKVFLWSSICLIFPTKSSSAVALFHFFPHCFTHVPFSIWIWPGWDPGRGHRGQCCRALLCPAMPGCFRGHRLGWDVMVWPGRWCCEAAPRAHLAGPSVNQADTANPLACTRDSCQMVAAFWSLPAKARFKLVSCGRPWISSSFLRMTFPLFFKLEFILLGRWCWCRLQRGRLNPESRGGWANQAGRF